MSQLHGFPNELNYVNINVKCTNVNAHVYSPDILVESADCTIYTPGIGTHSFTVSSPLGRIQHMRTFSAAITNHYNSAF